MDSSKEALMALNNFLMYQDLIDGGKAKNEKELLQYKQAASFWEEKYLTLTSSDESIWTDLGLECE